MAPTATDQAPYYLVKERNSVFRHGDFKRVFATQFGWLFSPRSSLESKNRSQPPIHLNIFSGAMLIIAQKWGDILEASARVAVGRSIHGVDVAALWSNLPQSRSGTVPEQESREDWSTSALPRCPPMSEGGGWNPKSRASTSLLGCSVVCGAAFHGVVFDRKSRCDVVRLYD
jgi:hypothetical protein